jgi:hypothetical protein
MKFRERAMVRGLYFPPSWGFHPADLRASTNPRREPSSAGARPYPEVVAHGTIVSHDAV